MSVVSSLGGTEILGGVTLIRLVRSKKYKIYLICDAGYLCWSPQLANPYKYKAVSPRKGYFSSCIESVHKDVECVFGILKKTWMILNYGICFHDSTVVGIIFVVHCLLHNNMLTEMGIQC